MGQSVHYQPKTNMYNIQVSTILYIPSLSPHQPKRKYLLKVFSKYFKYIQIEINTNEQMRNWKRGRKIFIEKIYYTYSYDSKRNATTSIMSLMLAPVLCT